MIDWYWLFANSLWLLGLAVLLATFSYCSYLTRLRQASPASLLIAVGQSSATPLAIVLICVGIILSSSLLLQAAASLLGLGLLYAWWRLRSVPIPTVAPLAVPATNAQPAANSQIRAAAEWLARTELIWLAVATPFLLFPNRTFVLALLVLPLLWIARWLARGHFVPATPFNWAIVLLLLMVLVSVFVTPSLQFSLSKITGVLLGVAVFYALVEWAATGKRMGWLLVGLVLATAGLLVVGLIGTYWFGETALLKPIIDRLPALLRGLPGAENGIDRNEIAGSLLWLLPLQFALLAATFLVWRGQALPWTPLLRLLLLLTILLSLGELALSQSLSALVGLVVGMAFLVLLLVPRLRLPFVALVVLLAGLFVFIGPQAIGDQLEALGLRARSNYEQNSIDSRLEIWNSGIAALKDYPLTGLGMNLFRYEILTRYPTKSNLLSIMGKFDVGHAHNQFLQVALDVGLPGLVAFLAIWLIALVLLWATWHRARDGLLRLATAGTAAGLLAYFVFGIQDTIALGAKPGVFFWVLLALAVVLRQSVVGTDTSPALALAED